SPSSSFAIDFSAGSSLTFGSGGETVSWALGTSGPVIQVMGNANVTFGTNASVTVGASSGNFIIFSSTGVMTFNTIGTGITCSSPIVNSGTMNFTGTGTNIALVGSSALFTNNASVTCAGGITGSVSGSSWTQNTNGAVLNVGGAFMPVGTVSASSVTN